MGPAAFTVENSKPSCQFPLCQPIEPRSGDCLRIECFYEDRLHGNRILVGKLPLLGLSLHCCIYGDHLRVNTIMETASTGIAPVKISTVGIGSLVIASTEIVFVWLHPWRLPLQVLPP